VDFYGRLSLLELNLQTKLDGPEAVEQRWEQQQLSDAGQNRPVDDAHRRNYEASDDQAYANEKADRETDLAEAALLLFLLDFF
jgi:hypothetical protein